MRQSRQERGTPAALRQGISACICMPSLQRMCLLRKCGCRLQRTKTLAMNMIFDAGTAQQGLFRMKTGAIMAEQNGFCDIAQLTNQNLLKKYLDEKGRQCYNIEKFVFAMIIKKVFE